MSHQHHTTPMAHTQNHTGSGMNCTTMNHGNMNHGGNSGHMMQMWFTTGHNFTLLFEGWKVNTVGELIGSMIALVLMGMVYEGIKVGREMLKRKAARPVIQRETYNLNGDGCKKDAPPTMIVSPPRQFMTSKLHMLQACLHMLQVFLGYLLMLAFMTYNAWLCLAIILGAGLGYFLFGWKSVTIIDVGDHCL